MRSNFVFSKGFIPSTGLLVDTENTMANKITFGDIQYLPTVFNTFDPVPNREERYKDWYNMAHPYLRALADFIEMFETWGKGIYDNFLIEVTLHFNSVYIAGKSFDSDTEHFVNKDSINLLFDEHKFIYADEFGDIIVDKDDFLIFCQRFRREHPGLNRQIDDANRCNMIESLFT